MAQKMNFSLLSNLVSDRSCDLSLFNSSSFSHLRKVFCEILGLMLSILVFLSLIFEFLILMIFAVEKFSIDRVNKSGAIFDSTKLRLIWTFIYHL